MSTDIKVPSLGESVVEATVAKWYKNAGDSVVTDEPLLELETDKVTLEVPSPITGKIEKILSNEGDTVAVGAVLGSIDETFIFDQSETKSQKIEPLKEPEKQEEIGVAVINEAVLGKENKLPMNLLFSYTEILNDLTLSKKDL